MSAIAWTDTAWTLHAARGSFGPEWRRVYEGCILAVEDNGTIRRWSAVRHYADGIDRTVDSGITAVGVENAKRLCEETAEEPDDRAWAVAP